MLGITTLSQTPISTLPSSAMVVTPGTASLTIATFAPVVLAPLTVTPGVASLTITTFSPTILTPVQVTPGVASLTLTTFAPVVTQGMTVTPGTASLVLTAFAPLVLTPRVVTPGTVSLAIQTFAPSVLTVVEVTPGTLSLVITGYVPTVRVRAIVRYRYYIMCRMNVEYECLQVMDTLHEQRQSLQDHRVIVPIAMESDRHVMVASMTTLCRVTSSMQPDVIELPLRFL